MLRHSTFEEMQAELQFGTEIELYCLTVEFYSVL